mmetsp:Transcript_53149/g.121119  ORF Transcript_53149/g.121119 Transcript_53149/m.121119 type:complete len:360 (+) Transcript_53149:212-1291(+)
MHLKRCAALLGAAMLALKADAFGLSMFSSRCNRYRRVFAGSPTSLKMTRTITDDSIKIRPLRSDNKAEFLAAVAVRAAVFLDSDLATSARGAFDNKLRRTARMMRSREEDGSKFVIALIEGGVSDEASRGLSSEAEEAGDLERDMAALAAEAAKPNFLGFFGGRGGGGGPAEGSQESEDNARLGLLPLYPDATAVERLESLTTLQDGARVVGMVDVSQEELLLPTHQLPTDGLYVCALSVLPEHRNVGVGRRLMERAEGLARTHGWGDHPWPEEEEAVGEGEKVVEPKSPTTGEAVGRLWLHVEDGEAGLAARALYEKLGFEVLRVPLERCYREFSEALDLGPNSPGAPPNRLMCKELE